MNAREKGPIEDEAIAWAIRTRDPAFEDWEGFTTWLERSEAHARAYDAVCAADEDFGSHFADVPSTTLPVPANDVSPQRRWWLGGAVAASLAAITALTLSTLDGNPYQAQEYRTAPGERRSVQLADGSRVEMNGATHLVVDGERHARLEQGQALFTIVHDANRPFEVASGNDVIRDLGTVFDVTRSPQTFSVSVSEGLILFNPDQEAVRVPAGKSLAEIGDRVVVRPVMTDTVGGWREGRLIYEAAPLSQVADDLTRSLGVSVAAEAAIASRPFSGIIQIEGKGQPALANAAEILGVELRRSGKNWVLTGR